MNQLRQRIFTLYDALYAHFGHEPHWWPFFSDDPPFEIIVGAVLVQQTRWEAVEAAIVRLRDAGLLSPAALAAADTTALAALIRPCAFHTQKAPGLQAICRHILTRHGGRLDSLFNQERAPLRDELLALPRIGPETADTIMLYAGGHPAFIVDAYARRLFARVDLMPGFDFTRASYAAVQELIEGALLDDRPPITDDGQPTTDDGPQATDAEGRLAVTEMRVNGEGRISQGDPCLGTYTHLDGSMQHFLWDLHALINEACIHHCLASNPRCDRIGARRRFVDPRKCAAHCLDCDGCPLRSICSAYQHARGGVGSRQGFVDEGS